MNKHIIFILMILYRFIVSVVCLFGIEFFINNAYDDKTGFLSYLNVILLSIILVVNTYIMFKITKEYTK